MEIATCGQFQCTHVDIEQKWSVKDLTQALYWRHVTRQIQKEQEEAIEKQREIDQAKQNLRSNKRMP